MTQCTWRVTFGEERRCEAAAKNDAEKDTIANNFKANAFKTSAVLYLCICHFTAEVYINDKLARVFTQFSTHEGLELLWIMTTGRLLQWVDNSKREQRRQEAEATANNVAQKEEEGNKAIQGTDAANNSTAKK